MIGRIPFASATVAVDKILENYGPKYSKAAASLQKDREPVLLFFDPLAFHLQLRRWLNREDKPTRVNPSLSFRAGVEVIGRPPRATADRAVTQDLA